MLNGEGNEGGNKINKSNYPKKVTNLHVQHTFLYIYLRRLLVFLFAFIFSLPLIFTLLGPVA